MIFAPTLRFNANKDKIIAVQIKFILLFSISSLTEEVSNPDIPFSNISITTSFEKERHGSANSIVAKEDVLHCNSIQLLRVYRRTYGVVIHCYYLLSKFAHGPADNPS